MKSETPHVTLYTDGACKGNPGLGGWGAVLIFGEHQKHLKGGEKITTNNRMEMTAVIEALKALKGPCAIDLFTDSQYVMRGVKEWMTNWKKSGWKTAGKQPVKNVDLWLMIDELIQHHAIQWHWVKGHSGDPGNELADALANEGAQEIANS